MRLPCQQPFSNCCTEEETNAEAGVEEIAMTESKAIDTVSNRIVSTDIW